MEGVKAQKVDVEQYSGSQATPGSQMAPTQIAQGCASPPRPPPAPLFYSYSILSTKVYVLEAFQHNTTPHNRIGTTCYAANM